MKTAEILTNAKFLIAQEKNWCQHKYYRANHSNDTVAYCSLGAINKVINGSPTFENRDSLDVAIFIDKAIGLTEEGYETTSTRLDRFNDEHTHAEVMQAFDKAIELAIERGI